MAPTPAGYKYFLSDPGRLRAGPSGSKRLRVKVSVELEKKVTKLL